MHNQKVYNLGVVEKGTPKLYDEIDLRPEDLRAFESIDEIWDKQREYEELLFSIEKLDLDILDMVKRKEMRAKDGLKSVVIIDQSHEKVKDAIRLLQKEKERITEVQVFRERDLAGIYNVEKLGNLEKELVSKIKTLEESGTASKALLLEHEKLLEEVRLLKERRSTVDKFTLAVYDLDGELHILGHVDKKGKATFLDEIDFKPQQLRALTVSDVLDKKNNYLWFQTQIQDYDRGLREMLKNGDVTKSTAIGANQILDRAILDTRKALATLDKEIERIIDVQRIRFLDLRFLYSKDNLRELEVTVTSALGALEESGTASKGLLSEYKKLLEQVRLAQKPETFYDYYMRTAYHTVSTSRFITNLKTVFSPSEMVKLREEAMKDAAKLDEIEKRLMLKGDANALRRAQRAKENSNLFLYLINSTKRAVEERLDGFAVTRSLLKKEDRLSESFTIDELRRLQRDVEKDIEFLSQVGTEKHILSLNKQLLDQIKSSMTKPAPMEGNFAVIETGIQSDQFLQGVIIERTSLSKLKELGNEGKNLLKALRDEEEEIVEQFHRRQINVNEAVDLLVKNDFKQRRLKYKLDVLWKYIEANK